VPNSMRSKVISIIDTFTLYLDESTKNVNWIMWGDDDMIKGLNFGSYLTICIILFSLFYSGYFWLFGIVPDTSKVTF